MARLEDPEDKPSLDNPGEPTPGADEGGGGEGTTPPSTPVSEILRSMADLLLPFPWKVSLRYLQKGVEVCAYLGDPAPLADRQGTGNEEQRTSNAANCRARYLRKIEEITSFATLAKSYGFSPPDNPFMELARLNATQRKSLDEDLVISSKLSEDLLYNITAYLDLLAAYKANAIDFNKGVVNAAQLAQVRISFDGYGGSGTPSADLMKFLPSADELKRKKAQEAFSVLDFSSRIPHVLFTLEYAPVQGLSRKGIIVGWRKMSDASGYTLSRRKVFSGEDKEISVTNQSLQTVTDTLSSYAQRYASSFFPRDNNVLLYLDEDIVDNEYYVYQLDAYQVRSNSKALIFSTQTTPVTITAAIQARITEQLKKIDPKGFEKTGHETVSPWPVVAQNILGSSDYDWLLAAVNIRASISRRDTRNITRSYSYLGSNSNFIFSQAQSGKFVKPNDLAKIKNNIRDAMQKFGASQTIQNILTESGVTYYFDGIDARDDDQFDRAGTLSDKTGKIFTTVASAIDPDTALLNVKSLAANMDKLLSNQDFLSSDTRLSDPGPAMPTEISMPDVDLTDDAFAESRLQFVTQIGNLDDPLIDLTTFEGISTLMRIIRIMTDFGPSKT